MATVYKRLAIEAALMRTAGSFPALNHRDGTGGTNPFPILSLAFDAATVERCFWQFRPTAVVNSGTFTIDIDWFAETASTGSVVWGCRMYAATPNVDTTDLETVNLGVQSTTTTAHPGTTAQRPIRSTISGIDPTVASNDIVWLALERLASNGSDTMAGDACVYAVTVSYSDV